MTWAEVYALARQMVEGAASGYETYSTTQLDAWAAEGQADACAYARSLQKREVLLTTASEYEVDLPDDAITVMRVTYDDEKLELVPLSHLRMMDADYYNQSGTPRYYYVDELNRKVGLHPTPSGSSIVESLENTGYGGFVYGEEPGFIVDIGYGDSLDVPGQVVEYLTGNGLEVFYTAAPPSDVDPNGEPVLPGWAHPLMVYYLCWRMRDARTHLRDARDADFWRMLYTRGKQRLLMRMNGRLPGNRAFLSLDEYGPISSRIARLPERIPEPGV